MDRNKLKKYAPAARQDFIKAITEKANLLGLSSKKIEPVQLHGDFALIAGRPFPAKVAQLRASLELSMKQEGFYQVMERIAYTWFNRFIALRYMELHSYLNHGYRVLSNRSGLPGPEILENAEKINLSGLDKKTVIDLKLQGNKDAELYRVLLVAQCNQLHKSMPFLFEKIDDESELLLPDNLLHTDSIIKKMVKEIPEDDWQDVEIIGWIYQFYFSEKKDQVIGKVLKSEDIPAATQLFTPNWIVKYMVQNSLGRKWLATYPQSKIRQKMDYYIEPAEQTAEVQAKLRSITPDSLDPERITLLDSACGSGHILVEAYDIFKEIYLERGYQTRDIPTLILEKNLYGLDIDDRAAQLAGFALLMKARRDDHEILDKPIKLNVLSIQSSGNINSNEISKYLFEDNREIERKALIELISLFKLGKTAGSLIRITDTVSRTLPDLKKVVQESLQSEDMFVRQVAESLEPIINQAILLGGKYDCVVANPPYMGRAYHNPVLKEYVKKYYRNYDTDTFSAFIVRDLELAKKSGYLGHMSPFVWMFISSYESLRTKIIDDSTITSLIQLEYSGFAGATVPVCTFTIQKGRTADYKGSYIRLSDFRGAENQGPKTLEAISNPNCVWMYRVSADNFHKIPGSPIAYWASNAVIQPFSQATNFLRDLTISDGQTKTGDNDRFLKQQWEVDARDVGPHRKWWQHPKGGPYRKWYGNVDWIIDWSEEARKHYREDHVARILPEYLWGKRGISWTLITSGQVSFRTLEPNQIFNLAAPSLFFHDEKNINKCLGFLNTKYVEILLRLINPTLNMNIGEVICLPLLNTIDPNQDYIDKIVHTCISIARSDWDSFETSWDFKFFPWLTAPLNSDTAEQSWTNWETHLNRQIKRMMELETENNRLWIEAYGLQDEMDPEVPEDQITLARPDKEKDVKRLISYAIGCMMGRYSPDEPGLIYSHSGNIGFDLTRYQTFQADDDGILPITDMEWFPEDVTIRFIEFIKTVWTADTLEDNLRFIATSLTGKQTTDSKETIRKYLCSSFFKDHLQTYKNRPIYWLFSSGKQKAFECLVYLHRYDEATLSRLRSNYVIPLQGKINGRIALMERDLNEGSQKQSTKIRKEIETLRKKQIELASFDDRLRHYADMKISLDLDDGVKVNYGKFGDLLAETSKVMGVK